VLQPHEATPDAISHAVRRILVEESFRAAAVGVANDIRTMPTPSEVAAALESR
jgi:UDP:flavonoid glycosyltransferase YjiC (YdhE family)